MAILKSKAWAILQTWSTLWLCRPQSPWGPRKPNGASKRCTPAVTTTLRMICSNDALQDASQEGLEIWFDLVYA
jgi:hypothetical protein